ncbi:MAG: sugar-binding protein [Gemmatimonadaceae bacterium]|nr:sugar-binding protein [Acetobacteraceae bacterium]
MKRRAVLALPAALALPAILSAGARAQAKPALAFVVNNPSDFWTIARRGIEKANREHPEYAMEMILPGQSTAAEQRRIVDELLVRKVAGIAISPINPANSTEMLNRAAAGTVLFCTDSDAPNSNRAVYIGTDNVVAGREAGAQIKRALPGGGKAMLFVGTMDADNARERAQGIKEALTGSNVELIDIRTDEADVARAKRNAEDVLAKYADIAVMAGLWSYNTPQIYQAVKAAGREGKVKVVGFDEDPITLRGITEGVISSTVVQQPYEFGYQSMKGLVRYIGGDKSFIPADKKIIVPTRIVDASNVAEFTSQMRELTRGK